MRAGIRKLWDHATRPAQPVFSAPSLNYVWIDDVKRARPRAPDAPLCAMKLRYLDRAFRNARLYPEASVTIWTDSATQDDESRYFIGAHTYINAPANVKLADLRSIPAYAADEVFAAPHESPRRIWARVDYARVLVCNHVLTEHEKAAQDAPVFYADFDVEDAYLRHPKLCAGMAKNGMVFGGTYSFTPLERWGSIVENSFMGFTRGAGHDFLRDELLPETQIAAINNENGYGAMRRCLRARFGQFGADWEHVPAPLGMVHAMGHKIQPDPRYERLGLNLG